jgi:hypothetical protein
VTVNPSVSTNVVYSYNGSVVVRNTTVLTYSLQPTTVTASTGSALGIGAGGSATYTVTISVSGGNGQVRFNATLRARYTGTLGASGTDTWVRRFDGSYLYLASVSYTNALNFASTATPSATATDNARYVGYQGFANHFDVTLSARTQTFTYSSTFRFSPDSLGRITASNGNIVVDVTGKLKQVQTFFSTSYLSLALYATTLQITLSNSTRNGFVLVFNTTGFAKKVPNTNPIVYIRDLNKFYPLAIYSYNTSKTIIAVPAQLEKGSYTVDIIWNYPFMMGTWSNMTKTVYDTPSKILTVLAVYGTVTVNDLYRPYHVNISGTASLNMLSGQLLEINYYLENGVAPRRIVINSYTFFIPRIGYSFYGNVQHGLPR